MRGLYLNSGDVDTFNPTLLVNGGITDVFVLSSRFSTSNNYSVILPKVLSKLKGTGIRVHAWIICFSDAQGSFINPTNNTYYLNQLIDDIGKIVNDYDIDGVQLDYVRYPIDNPAYKYINGDEYVTNFTRSVRDKIKGIKPEIMFSAALVPEWYEVDSNIVNDLNRQGDISKGVNTTLLYGQNYVAMSEYLDFLVPMVYRGFSLKLGSVFRDTFWVESTTRFAVERVNKPVVSALTTYISNDELETSLTLMSVGDVNRDIQSVYSGGGKGFALFRYGVLDKNFFSDSTNGGDLAINQTNNSSILNKTSPGDVFLNQSGFPLFILFGFICFGIGYWRRK
jgi:hypothetical protein